jgi:hypothetical protein
MEHQHELESKTHEASEQNDSRRHLPSFDRAPPSSPILQLQQSIGNRAVQRLLANWSVPLQAKLIVGAARDPYEQEAEGAAQQVLNMPAPAYSNLEPPVGPSQGPEKGKVVQTEPLARTITPFVRSEPAGSASGSFTPASKDLLQRRCACGGVPGPTGECEACRQKRLQRNPKDSELGTQGDLFAPPIVHQVLGSPGESLDPVTRAFMEPRFRHDFSQVRVHRGAEAAASARAIRAPAYTVGNHMVFGTSQYAPNTGSGRRLIAHELVHTLQQRSAASAIGPTIEISSHEDPAEQEADKAANTIPRVPASADINSYPARVSRQDDTAKASAETPPLNPASPEAAPQNLTCVPAPGIPNTDCSAYLSNAWWLPLAYVNNATCACNSTPNVLTANCVRKFLQGRLAATPTWLKLLVAAQKPLEISSPAEYQAFVQAVLTPRIYQDHVDAYRGCCCPSGPAAYYDWIGVTLVPIQPCSLVGLTIRYFGSCSGTAGVW